MDSYTDNLEIEVEDIFDGEKILNEYEKMTKEDAINLLGEKYASVLIQRIKDKNINFEEFQDICNQAIPKYPQRAKWISSIIYNKLSKEECLSMHGVDSLKLEMVKKLDDYRDKVSKGCLMQRDLMDLCDITFGKGTKESIIVYESMKGLVNVDEKEFFTKKFMIVDSGKIGVNDEEKSIVGVQGLGPCIGLILYNREHKKVFVSHVKPEQIFNEGLSNKNISLNELEIELFGILMEQQMINCDFELILVEGAYRNTKEIYFDDLDILKDSTRFKYIPIEVLEIKLKKIEFININSVRIIKKEDLTPEVQISDAVDLSKQFAFDAESGQFVTDKVYFGDEYFKFVNNHVR